jgi:ATP-dependent 26S proteasome regulatory subunit
MQFRNLRAEELEGSVDIPGLNEWMRTIGATDATVLILAPPGTGKAAAVGKLAHRLGRNVLLCNMMELFDNDDPKHQLQNLLRLCEAQKHSVIYLDKLDKAIVHWARTHEGDMALAKTLEEWLPKAKARLLEDECTVVFTGRDAAAVPPSLLHSFDKHLSV